MVSGLNTDFGNWNLRQMNNPLGWAQAFPEGEIDISKLPPALRQKIEAQRANFGEGDKDKIDTQDEVRKFAELLGQELQNTPGAPPGFDPQLLIDWVLNKQPEQNRPTGGGGQDRGTMSGQNFAQTQPASFSGGSGGGTSGGGGSTGGTSTGGT